MDAISPDIARKLLTRDIANLAQRVQRGGNLSRSERAMLQGMAASSGPAQATVAENYVELARILFRSRSFDLPDSYRLPDAEPEVEPVRVVLGERPQRGALHK